MRCGNNVEAFEVLTNSNLGWMAASLLGGLPFHDFYNADIVLAEDLSRDIRKFKRHVDNEFQDVDLFDFMKNKELDQVCTERKSVYMHHSVRKKVG